MTVHKIFPSDMVGCPCILKEGDSHESVDLVSKDFDGPSGRRGLKHLSTLPSGMEGPEGQRASAFPLSTLFTDVRR